MNNFELLYMRRNNTGYFVYISCSIVCENNCAQININWEAEQKSFIFKKFPEIKKNVKLMNCASIEKTKLFKSIPGSHAKNLFLFMINKIYTNLLLEFKNKYYIDLKCIILSCYFAICQLFNLKLKATRYRLCGCNLDREINNEFCETLKIPGNQDIKKVSRVYKNWNLSDSKFCKTDFRLD